MNPEGRRGVGYGFLAYLLWGIFPLYFRLLDRSGSVEIVLHRVIWSLAVCLVVIAVTRAGRRLVAVLRSPSALALLCAAAAVLALNWGTYVYAVNSGQVVQASLGYFVNPLVTVMLGVLVLRERLRRAQWVAVAVGALAVVVLTVDYGRPPWIALTLALTFGAYGLIKNRVGPRVGALEGLTTETLTLAPLALAALVWLEISGRGNLTANPPWQALLLASVGIATVVPLVLFAAAARRIPLSLVGLLQYITPTLQLLCGLLLLGEDMQPSRWIGFGLVWVALAVLSVDGLRASRARSTAQDRVDTFAPTRQRVS